MKSGTRYCALFPMCALTIEVPNGHSVVFTHDGILHYSAKKEFANVTLMRGNGIVSNDSDKKGMTDVFWTNPNGIKYDLIVDAKYLVDLSVQRLASSDLLQRILSFHRVRCDYSIYFIPF